MRRHGAALLTAIALASPCQASEPLQGYFIAQEACAAYQSMNRRTNPGTIRTEASVAYAMTAINKPGGDYFQIRVPGAPVTEERWVRASCGVHAVEPAAPKDPMSGDAARPLPTAESQDHVLALNWQPAFCETRAGRGKVECDRLHRGDLPEALRGLSIHGLWPQPRGNDYCGVPSDLVALSRARRWSDLPEPELDENTRAALTAAMPGAASFLHRHEWIKHGVCHGGAGGADEYFDDTLLVVDAINDSAVAAFMEDRMGRTVATASIRKLFDDAFGAGAGDKVAFKCVQDGARILIQELRINLRGRIAPDMTITDLFMAAPDARIGCDRGVIDPNGLQ